MRIYVTGGMGLLGSNFIKVAQEHHGAKIFATIHKHQPTSPVPFEYDRVSICDRDRVIQTVREFQPDAIVHAAILNDLPLMYKNRKLGWESLVDATHYLAEAAREVGAKMILVSTDWVFDGTQGPADEITPPNPINYYGFMKAVGETLVSTLTNNWAVARVAGVFGVQWAHPEQPARQNAGFGSLPNAVVEALRRNQPFTVWDGDVNVCANPTLASEASEMIMKLIKSDSSAIFHCCGGDYLSRLDLAYATAEVFRLDPELISIGPPDPADPNSFTGIPLPRDTSLRAAGTAEHLGHPLIDIRQALTRFRHQVEMGTL